MITFFCCIAFLVLGYIFYGRYVTNNFGPSSKNVTPAIAKADGVDNKVLPPWKLFIIQFLNIAGLGPIFGAILGAAYGPMAYIWIVVGSIFMGSVHDYFAGMISVRSNGANIPDIVGNLLGNGMRKAVLIISVFLLIVVAASFVSGPSDLLALLTKTPKVMWVIIIFVYFGLAALVPIDKIIGRFYPIFGGFLIFMALAVAVMLIIHSFSGDLSIPELSLSSFKNMHANPDTNILFPMMFIVISCGALSGFHATQSPLMARCMADEKYGRPVFYGAMICESIIAMIWATVAISYLGGVDGLNAAAAAGKTPAILVEEICSTWLGKFGAAIAIIGVVVCPITSGDTALRSCRLIIADKFKIDQKPLKNRLFVAIPLFVISILLCFFNFAVVWQYVGILNQLIATIILWTITEYLRKNKKNYWITFIGAAFMTYICFCYIFIAPISSGGLSLNHTFSYVAAGVIAFAVVLFFFFSRRPYDKPRTRIN